METLKCGACQTVYSDDDNLTIIAGSGMCVDCNMRWLNDVESVRWDDDGGHA
jgi:hypothetical protein